MLPHPREPRAKWAILIGVDDLLQNLIRSRRLIYRKFSGKFEILLFNFRSNFQLKPLKKYFASACRRKHLIYFFSPHFVLALGERVNFFHL